MNTEAVLELDGGCLGFCYQLWFLFSGPLQLNNGGKQGEWDYQATHIVSLNFTFVYRYALLRQCVVSRETQELDAGLNCWNLSGCS